MPPYHAERQCAEAIARRAGHHILDARRRHLDVSLKAPDDVVTNVDRSTEQLIIERLAKAFPDDHIDGEEFGTSQDGHQDSQRRWLVDPIDGTLNFAHGIPTFCVSIAFQHRGHTRACAIYDPNRDELFSAAEGDGAHLNADPIEVSAIDELSPAVLVTGFPLGNTPAFEATMKQFNDLTRASRGIRRLGSAAIDLAYVAAGRLEAFWEYNLKPWDTAAGYLLVQEAGGRVTQVTGDPFDVYSPHIVASNGHTHGALLEILNQSHSD